MRKKILTAIMLGCLSVIGIEAYAQFYVVKDGQVVYGLDEGTADYVTFEKPTRASLLLEEEPEYVDLGLASKTLWAKTNVGAQKPEDCGDYYSFGEILKHYTEFDSEGSPVWENGKEGYDWDTYTHSDESGKLKKYVPNEKAAIYGLNGKSDGKNKIGQDDDIARVMYGEGWQIPSTDDFIELYEQCKWEWTNDYEETGVAGYIISSKQNENEGSIFLPASGNIWRTERQDINSFGYYWTNDLDVDRYDFATYLFIYEGYIGPWHNGYRYIGRTIRPIYKNNSSKKQ